MCWVDAVASDSPPCTSFFFSLFPPFQFPDVPLNTSKKTANEILGDGSTPGRHCSPADPGLVTGLAHAREPRVCVHLVATGTGWERQPQKCRREGPALPAPSRTLLFLPTRGRDAGAPGHGLPYPMCTESLQEIPIGCGVAIGSASGCVQVAQLPQEASQSARRRP